MGSMILLEIARKRGRMNDSILKFPTAVLELEQVIDGLQEQIKKLTMIEMGEDGLPVVSGFSDEQKVARLQNELNDLLNIFMDQSISYVTLFLLLHKKDRHKIYEDPLSIASIHKR